MELIPAIDLLSGRCVRLSQGSYESPQVYEASPLEMAKAFEEAGLKRLHLVDLDGAKTGAPQSLSLLKEMAKQSSLVIDFSGGLRSLEGFKQALDAGASYLCVGSLAAREPELFKQAIEEFGADTFILSADSKDGEIRTEGWLENSGLKLEDFISYWLSEGISKVYCTDIKRDGLLSGPSIELYKKLIKKFPDIELTASGGVSSMSDLQELSALGLQGAIIGKAIYEGQITLEELGAYQC